jgi:hypothetical protein
MNSFIVNEKTTPAGQVILVITDSELVGKVFTEGNKQLDLSKDFYKGEEKNIKEVKEIIEKAYVLHLTGKNIIQVCTDLGYIEKVIVIDNIPHAEVLVE